MKNAQSHRHKIKTRINSLIKRLNRRGVPISRRTAERLVRRRRRRTVELTPYDKIINHSG